MDNEYVKKLPLILSTLYVGTMSFGAFLDPLSRTRLNARQKLTQWSDMFRASLVPMTSLCVLSSLAGFLRYYQTMNASWAVGSGIMAAILPYTMVIVRPVFSRLLDEDKKDAPKDSDEDIGMWLGLHKFRVLLAVVAAAFFMYA